MKVKAKFNCLSVKNWQYGKEAELNAIYGTEGENADFTKATPNGKIMIAISNDVPASEFFIPGENYYLTFEKEEK
jgi:hypothetical protein